MEKLNELILKHYPQYHNIETYPADKCAVLCRIAGEWGVFSNFARTPLVVDGVPFDTSERLFQVMKFTDAADRAAVYAKRGNPKMTARHLEKLGRRRPDWGAMVVDVMKFCLVQKYEQSAEFREALERSRGLCIVEDQTTFPGAAANVWGVKPSADGASYVGPNVLGRLLMELRDAGGVLDWTLPEGATGFGDLLRKEDKD